MLCVLQEASQLQQVAAWKRVQELKAAQAKAQKAKAALAHGMYRQSHGHAPDGAWTVVLFDSAEPGNCPHACQRSHFCSDPCSELLQGSYLLTGNTAPVWCFPLSCLTAQQQLHSLKAASTQRRQVLEQLVHRTAATRTAVLGTELPNVLRIQALTLSHVNAMLEREQRMRLRQLTEIFPLRINAVRSSGGPITITICNLKLPQSASCPAGGWPEPEVRQCYGNCSVGILRPGRHVEQSLQWVMVGGMAWDASSMHTGCAEKCSRRKLSCLFLSYSLRNTACAFSCLIAIVAALCAGHQCRPWLSAPVH